jgi:hypothetical protein
VVAPHALERGAARVGLLLDEEVLLVGGLRPREQALEIEDALPQLGVLGRARAAGRP